MTQSRWPHFTPSELQCRCGQCGPESAEQIHPDLLDALEALRTRLGFALPVSSGYRCPRHPAEARKAKPGRHAQGLAVDIAISGARAWRLLTELGALPAITGIGIQQQGTLGARFIHLDIDTHGQRPWLWSY